MGGHKEYPTELRGGGVMDTIGVSSDDSTLYSDAFKEIFFSAPITGIYNLFSLFISRKSSSTIHNIMFSLLHFNYILMNTYF